MTFIDALGKEYKKEYVSICHDSDDGHTCIAHVLGDDVDQAYDFAEQIVAACENTRPGDDVVRELVGEVADGLKELRERVGQSAYGSPREVIDPLLLRVLTFLSHLDAKEGGEVTPQRPKRVCLCGSTRFMDAFHEANRKFSLEGLIVLTVEIVTYDGATDPQKADLEQKCKLDELHLRKIDLADLVYVLNVDGYIGESTKAEIEYAEKAGKPIKYLALRGELPKEKDD